MFIITKPQYLYLQYNIQILFVIMKLVSWNVILILQLFVVNINLPVWELSPFLLNWIVPHCMTGHVSVVTEVYAQISDCKANNVSFIRILILLNSFNS